MRTVLSLKDLFVPFDIWGHPSEESSDKRILISNNGELESFHRTWECGCSHFLKNPQHFFLSSLMPVFPLNTNVSQVFVLFSSSTAPSNFIYSHYFTVCMLIITKFIALAPHCHVLNCDFYTSETELICSTRQFLTLIAYILLFISKRFCEVITWYNKKNLNFKIRKAWVQILPPIFTSNIP